MTERVFVTGAGIVSAMGIGVEETLNALKKEESCIGPITHLETEHRLPAGEVRMSNAEMASVLGAGYPENELRTVLMGIMAGREAVASADLPSDSMGGAVFINGTTVGGMDKTERHFKAVYNSEWKSEETVELRFNDCGCSTEQIADGIGSFAAVTTTSTACSSAANAIILGANMIKAGLADIVVAGGSESLTRFHVNGFNTLMILDSERCRPFDRDRNGINLGEGAAYVVLESERSAKRRGAGILAELKGYGNSCDAFHQTATSEEGEGAYLSMRKAMDMARLTPHDIDYINAHGTGTPNNDRTELAAMQRIWGHKLPAFSSTKGFTGHTTSASGAIESVMCLLAINHGILPANPGWSNPIAEDAIPVTANRYGCEVRNVINNSFGFGGNDSTLIYSKYEERNG